MAGLSLSYKELIALKPCAERRAIVAKMMGGARKWAGQIDASAARAAGVPFNDIVWAASTVARSNADVNRRLRLWMADCAAHALRIYEKTETSDAPRRAIVAARSFARGEIDEGARAAARDAAWDAAWAAARDAAWAAARAAARAAAWDAAWAAARDAARAAAWDAARAAAWDAARAAEETWQFDRLVLWLSQNEPDDWPLPTMAEVA